MNGAVEFQRSGTSADLGPDRQEPGDHILNATLDRSSRKALRELLAKLLPVFPVDLFACSGERAEEAFEFDFVVYLTDKPLPTTVTPDGSGISPEVFVGSTQIEIVEIGNKFVQLTRDARVRFPEGCETERFEKGGSCGLILWA